MSKAHTSPRYISPADTAKLVRQALKAAFPAVKFSVRSKTYAGGASITVSWTDGPTAADVEAVTNGFQGASFDGMQDLKSYHTSTLDGERVRYGADYIFTDRSFSLDFLRRRAESVAHRWGCAVVTFETTKWGGTVARGGEQRIGNYTVEELVYQAARKTRAAS